MLIGDHELSELVVGARQGRRSEEEITLFESQGLAIEDVASAKHVYEQGRALGGLRYHPASVARRARVRSDAPAPLDRTPIDSPLHLEVRARSAAEAANGPAELRRRLSDSIGRLERVL